MKILVLCLFDTIVGPRVLLRAPRDVDDPVLERIPDAMDLYSTGFSIQMANRTSMAHYIFEIDHPRARGNVEMLQISVVVKKGQFVPQSTEHLLQTFVDKFKAIPEVYRGLYPNSSEYRAETRAAIEDLFYSFFEVIQPTIQVLREAELQYQILFQNARDAITVLDYDTATYLDMNAQAEQLLGLSRDEVVGLPAEHIHADGEYEAIRTQILHQINNPEAPPVETHVVRADGTRVPVEITANKVTLSDKRVIFSIVRDMTERRRAEAKIQKRLRYEEGLAKCSAALIEHDPESWALALGHLLEATGVSRVFIYESSSFFNGADPPACYLKFEAHQPDVPALDHFPDRRVMTGDGGEQACLGVLRRGEPYEGDIAEMDGDQHAYFKRYGVKSVLFLPIQVKGRWYGFIGLEDVEVARSWSPEDTRLLQTAAEVISAHLEHLIDHATIKTSERTTKLLLNSSTDAAFLVDHQGTIEVGNARAAQIFGSSPHALKGKKFFSLFPAPELQESESDLLADLLAAREPVSLQQEVEGRSFSLHVHPVRDDEDNLTRLAIFARWTKTSARKT